VLKEDRLKVYDDTKANLVKSVETARMRSVARCKESIRKWKVKESKAYTSGKREEKELLFAEAALLPWEDDIEEEGAGIRNADLEKLAADLNLPVRRIEDEKTGKQKLWISNEGVKRKFHAVALASSAQQIVAGML